MASVRSSTSAWERKAPPAGGLVGRTLNLLSSAPFGIVLLIMLIIACTIGNVYQTKYFSMMLVLLGLNIILVSIKHFPAAFSYLLFKKLTVSPTFVIAQSFKEKIELPILGREQLVERAAAAAKSMKFKISITFEETETTIFAERDAWNRLGTYAVLVGLLTIFASSFWNNSCGYTGWMWIEPGRISDKLAQKILDVENSRMPYAAGQEELQLPFRVEGLDIQQKLIDKNRPIDLSNALDWLTRVRIHDHETRQETEAVVRMNSPFDYRGHRFLQVAFDRLGNARSIKLKLTPTSGGASEEVTIGRNGKVKLSDGTELHYFEFNPSFTVNANQEVGSPSRDFVNPAARLAYLTPRGRQGEMWAFTESFINEISNEPVLKSKFLDAIPYRLTLTDFEKVPLAHLLQVQY